MATHVACGASARSTRCIVAVHIDSAAGNTSKAWGTPNPARPASKISKESTQSCKQSASSMGRAPIVDTAQSRRLRNMLAKPLIHQGSDVDTELRADKELTSDFEPRSMYRISSTHIATAPSPARVAAGAMRPDPPHGAPPRPRERRAHTQRGATGSSIQRAFALAGLPSLVM